MKTNFIIILMILVPSLVFSQEKIRLTGKVLEAKTNIPIPFAYIKLKNIALGTVTNPDGEFRIGIPSRYAESTLVFSYLGYKSFEVKLSSINNEREYIVHLDVDSKLLQEVVITPKKEINAIGLLKKAIKKIPENYPQESFHMGGYYRETLKENGAFIKYADAVSEYNYQPYLNKKYKWKAYQQPVGNFTNNLSNSYSTYGGHRMHRYHFHRKTLKKDQVKILEARASENQTKTHLTANIEGGPLGILGKDRVKFRKHFMDPKKFDNFIYEVGEFKDENGKWQYVISFKPKIKVEKIEKKKTGYHIYAKRTLRGKIYMNQDDFAITSFEYAVPSAYKKFICSYEGANIQHFGYKVKLDYKKIDGQYIINHIRQEDEFIIVDTLENETTPYAAVSELFINSYDKNNKENFSKNDILLNTDASQLFEYPLDVNQKFWKEYQGKYNYVGISENIRKDMEEEKPLEKQFIDKLKRDENIKPPVALKNPLITKLHGDKRTDNYHWMKDTRAPFYNKQVMDYLQKENKYVNNYFRPLRATQKTLYNEMVKMTEEHFESLPTKDNGYYYYYKYKKDWEYPIYYRKEISGGKEEVLLDVGKNAQDKSYYDAGVVTASPNNKLLAFYENTTGSDRYILKVKDLETSQILEDSIIRITGFQWIDDQSFFYVVSEPGTLRQYQLRKHTIGNKQHEDPIVYEEKDRSFNIDITRSKSKEYIFLNCISANSTEIHYYQFSQPGKGFVKMYPREKKHIYSVKHYKDKFFILTNKKAINNKLVKVAIADCKMNNWEEVIPHNKKVLLNGFDIFDKYLALSEKENAVDRIKIINKITGKSHYIKNKENISSNALGYNPDFDTDTIQYTHTSFKTPQRVYNYHMESHDKRLVKRPEINTVNYGLRYLKVKRVWAKARDGEKIPMTLVYRSFAKNAKDTLRKVYMTSYGAYGSGMNIGFNPTVNSLLSRGFIYVIAHVRGGNDLGLKWHDEGKLLNKMNTFTDFIDCTEHLIKEKYVLKGNIVAQGGSAGGLLMGAIANLRPDLYKAIILDVPFVDVINTMMDDKLPLTTGEYKEWGNPNVKKYYNYIKQYSPYDNVKAQNYPHMIFSTSLNDTRVGYWEPAKMVAKLREMKTDDNYIFLKTEYFGGHSGGSGRYNRFRDLSYKWSIIFDLFDNK